MNEAALIAARANKDAVGMADFEAAVDRVIGGLEKKNKVGGWGSDGGGGAGCVRGLCWGRVNVCAESCAELIETPLSAFSLPSCPRPAAARRR